MRFVRFQDDKRETSCNYQRQQTHCSVNCSVKKVRSGDGLELIVTDQTQINKSPKKFDLEVKAVLVQDTNI